MPRKKINQPESVPAKEIKPPQYDPDDVAFPVDDFLNQVRIVTSFDRQAYYGDALPRLTAVGLIMETLNTLMPSNITPCQSHLITMLTEKLTRAACNPNKADTWIDIAGYARFGYEARRK